MKNTIACLLLGLLLCSCVKEEFNDGLTPCNLDEQVKSVKDIEGVVSFNSMEQVYVVVVSIEGTIDVQDIGFVCNLPVEYQHEGLKIRFSGIYYEYDGRYGAPPIGGQTYYYLELRNIAPTANE